jgi:DNA-binding MarR family transcriptional regulator
MTDVPGDELTRLVDAVIGLAGAFVEEGDRLAASSGLTAARWLVLGAVQDAPATVAEIARRRGLRRQSVRETVTRLEASGFVVRRTNPDDARAPLVALTRQGRRALRRIEPRRSSWATEVEARHDLADLRRAVVTLNRLRVELTAAAAKVQDPEPVEAGRSRGASLR